MVVSTFDRTALSPVTVNTNVESNAFCAYGKIFVEFFDRDSKWGTMLLDNDGRPIDCNQYLGPKPFNYDKGI